MTHPGDQIELTFDLVTTTAFPPYRLVVTQEAVDEYYALTPVPRPPDSNIVPSAFAFIVGRRAYLEGFRMPPGGVLLGQELEWVEPVAIGAEIVAQPRLHSVKVRAADKRDVTIETTARQHGQLSFTVRMTARWPR